ncbi:MAG TPA: serine/threonine-protein kinase [Candidatus Polarisedimenticolia bacterium]|nr:serine/threonine-protein kinase [Candidatus Polarisedimenticolia bacterium]
MLDNRVLGHLREVADLPDLSATKYEIVGRLGQGGMGTVYLVRDTELSREVALKVLSVADPAGDLSSRLLMEARHLASLEHPNIVPVHDVGTLPDGRVFYVMKLVRGKRLDEWRREGTTRPSLLRLFQKVCGAVAFAHANGVMHRDLKPENIMVGPFGEALVMDWGAAKLLAQTHVAPADEQETIAGDTGEGRTPEHKTLAAGHTAQGTVIGTPAYMAPEQARGDVRLLDARTDVYALGAILYYILSGRPPFAGETPREVLAKVLDSRPAALRQIDPTVPRPLESICARAMSPDAADRYETAQLMADDVDRFLDGLPVQAHKENAFERAGRLLNRYRFFIYLAVAYLLLRTLAILVTLR